MALEQQIQKDIMAAMKAKDQVRLNAVRSIKSAILLAKTAEGASGELTDGDIVKLIQKLAKQRKEAAEQYVAAGRQTTNSPRRKYWPSISQSRYLRKNWKPGSGKSSPRSEPPLPRTWAR